MNTLISLFVPWFICTKWSVWKYDIWTANQIAAYINAWLELKNQNQDGLCPSLGQQIKNDLIFLLFICTSVHPFHLKIIKISIWLHYHK